MTFTEHLFISIGINLFEILAWTEYFIIDFGCFTQLAFILMIHSFYLFLFILQLLIKLLILFLILDFILDLFDNTFIEIIFLLKLMHDHPLPQILFHHFDQLDLNGPLTTLLMFFYHYFLFVL